MFRWECESGPRPCPYLSCRHHLAADVSHNGNIHFSFLQGFFDGEEQAEPDGVRETCALDIASRGPAALEDVAAVLGVTRERIRQIEAKAIRKLQLSKKARQLRVYHQPD